MADTPTGSSNRAQRTPSAQTPSNRTINVDPPSQRGVHTPLNRTGPRNLASSGRRGPTASGGRGNAPTPHAAAARRAIQERRTALFTPGRNRRKGQAEQRETPMGLLRNVARALAPSTQPVASSSSPRDNRAPSSIGAIPEDPEEDRTIRPAYDDDDDEDSDLPMQPPRLSLPIDTDDDTTELEPPPRLSGITEYNYTGEIPRREPQRSRRSRGSLGSVESGDFFDPGEPTEDFGRPSDFFPGLLENIQATTQAAGLERTDNDTTRRITVGGQSDLAIQVPPEIGDNTTFRMSDPPDDAAPTSPIGATAPVAGGGDTYGNISFIPEDPSGIAGLDLDTPGGNDNDDDDDDNDDQGEPEPFWDQPEAEVTEVQAAEAAERGRGRDRPMPDYDSQEEIEPGEDSDPADTTRPDISTIEEARARRARQIPKSRKRQKRISRHGTEYPPLPQPFVRRVAQRAVQTSGLSNHRISTDVLASLTQASEWFFEQLGDDLGAYADHAKRTVIEESDVITLMRRQRQVGSDATLFSLAQRHLPRELLQELRMPVAQVFKSRRGKNISRYDDDEDVSELS